MVIPVEAGRLACDRFKCPGKIAQAFKSCFSGYFRKSGICGQYQELCPFYTLLIYELKGPEAGVPVKRPGEIIGTQVGPSGQFFHGNVSCQVGLDMVDSLRDPGWYQAFSFRAILFVMEEPGKQYLYNSLCFQQVSQRQPCIYIAKAI